MTEQKRLAEINDMLLEKDKIVALAEANKINCSGVIDKRITEIIKERTITPCACDEYCRNYKKCQNFLNNTLRVISLRLM